VPSSYGLTGGLRASANLLAVDGVEDRSPIFPLRYAPPGIK